MQAEKTNLNKSLSFVKGLVIRANFINKMLLKPINLRFFVDKSCFFFVISQIISYFACV